MKDGIILKTPAPLGACECGETINSYFTLSNWNKRSKENSLR